MIHGIRIITSPYALKDTDERLFPVSKNRSRRIHKKLIKRFGGEFRKVPAIYQTPDGLIMHPAMELEFRRRLSDRDAMDQGMRSILFG